MAEDEKEATRHPISPKLVQPKITSLFSRSHPAPNPSASPVSTTSASLKQLDLHTERRSNLERPPPRLSRATRSALLAETAKETKALLPTILKNHQNAPPDGQLCTRDKLPRLKPKYCPRLPKTKIRVVNADTIEAALHLSASEPQSPNDHEAKPKKPVLVLNMANAHHSGGGWLHGSLAQEEALCYRSSLSFTLKNKFYPIPDDAGIYSPTVLVIRESMADGHRLLQNDMPLISCASVAAVQNPKLAKTAGGEVKYAFEGDREGMKEKMRVVLRIAAANGHRRLVLGALGCGAFGNPRGEVLACWKDIFGEDEFIGGWWSDVVFAVMEPGEDEGGKGNFGVFWRRLNGLEV